VSETFGGRTFDRIERVDPRSFDYLIAGSSLYVSAEDRILQKQIDALKAAVAALTPPGPSPAPLPPPAPAATVWAVGQVLDQGQTGMCVGYAWAGWAMTSPGPKVIAIGVGGDDEGSTADVLYDQARRDDGDPNPEDPQGGASTTGGANASKDLGFARSYVWALNVAQLVAGIQKIGPAVCGVPWRSTMMTPDAHGVLDVGDKSQDVGGHEILIPRYFPAGAPGNPSAVEDMLGGRQSWGTGWAQGGDYFIPTAGFADLFADGADATVPVKA
jgi:hypothetical protein